MRFFDRFRMAVATLFHRNAETERLNDELQFHLQQQIAENIAHGMTEDEARSAALRTFGNPTLLRDQARSQWSWNGLEKFFRDLRYGARTLSRSPGFAIIAILVMALGIGATASLFTIVNAVLLKPLPFRDPGRLVMIYEHFRTATANSDGFNYNVVSAADFNDWRRQTHSFQDMAAWKWHGVNLTGEHGDLPENVLSSAGSWNLFSVLDVPMALGRAFTPQEDVPVGDQVVILTWSLYQRRFNGNPSVLGKHVLLNGVPHTIVGVLPRWFSYPSPQVQLWVPYASTFTPEEYAHHDFHGSWVIARLRPGISAAAAVKPVSALQYQMHLANLSAPVAEDVVTRPMIDDVVHDVKPSLIMLICAVGCMLLIACLNVSNLLVARGAARRKEVAVRGALGGSRLTLILEQMVESLLICFSGGVLGLLLSLLATKWIATHMPSLPRANEIHVDGTVFLFSLGIAFLAALLAGLLPAISSTGKDVLGALQDSSRSSSGSASRAMLRKALLTAEIALTVVLLISAGLLFKNFLHLRGADLGCVTDHVLTMQYGLPEKQYDTPAKITDFHASLLERVRRLPGVRSAALVSTAPGGGYGNDNVFTIPSRPSTSFQLQDDALVRSASPGYFSTMQIPLLRGRVFTEQERLDRYHYIVVSKKFANQFFPNANPIGEIINIHWSGKLENYQIIGVVGDTLYDVTDPIKATVYFPILFRHSPRDQRRHARRAHGRGPPCNVGPHSKAVWRVGSAASRVRSSDDAADHQQKHHPAEFQRHHRARLRGSVFVAGRHRPLRRALLSRHPASERNWHSPRPRRATSTSAAPRLDGWSASCFAWITYRTGWRHRRRIHDSLYPLWNPHPRSRRLCCNDRLSAADCDHRLCRAGHSRFADRTYERPSNRVETHWPPP